MHQVPAGDEVRAGGTVLDGGVDATSGQGQDDEQDGAPAPEPRVRTVTGPDGPVRVHVFPGRALPRGARRPTLVAFHGWTDSGECFGPLAAALGRRWTVVAPDAPAHGGTPWTPAPVYSVPDHVRSAVAVVDALPRLTGRRAPAVLLGHSMGAVTAARVAVERPGQVQHAGLLDGDDAHRIAYLRREHPDWPADEHAAWARSKAEVDARHLEGPIDWGEPLMALLAETHCPVTLVRGDPARGGIVSATAARRCAAVCAGGCEVVGLESGHNPRREARPQFVAALAAVLGRYER
jgi:pimeloyl-ACP methyl ester carboxylesterase